MSFLAAALDMRGVFGTVGQWHGNVQDWSTFGSMIFAILPRRIWR
jgi:hypothetical protein